MLREWWRKLPIRPRLISPTSVCDALPICVPTPLNKIRKPDMSFIESACMDIRQHIKFSTFISLESTTYPHTTEDLMLPIIERTSGMKHDMDFWSAESF